MSRKTDRAAAIATAMMCVFTLAATDGSGARAQDRPAQPIEAEAPADDAAEIRFVPGEVVQPLPDQTAATAQASPAAANSLRALVAAMDDRQPLSRDLHCLATAIYYEARGETLDGQLAVGQVIANRTQSGLFPRDYCGVVTQRGQFSFVSRGTMPRAPQGSTAWQRATAIARIVHEDLWDSAADDALFFHARHVRPQWANRKLARAAIDGHLFYR